MTIIDCVLLTDTGKRVRSTNPIGGIIPVYSDGNGNEYHLSNVDLTLESGEILKQAPVGSMWSADWYDGFYKPGPDGIWLIVKTPGGNWFVDGPSSNGSGWTREGTAPNVTVTPSILQSSYHGFLTGGKLISV